MAQTNFTPILLYASSTPTNVPSAGNLTNSATGSELAINIADKNLFFKDSGGIVNTVPIRQSSTSSNGWLSSTDWNTFNNKAPATSGTSILYGNGSGGFSNVIIGTGITFAGGTLSATGTGGTVTAVTGTAPVVSSGGTTPAISMPAATTSVNGYLTSTDWNTFNNKQPAGTYVTSVAATSPVTSSGGTTPTIAMPAATTSVSGYLTSTDWNTFNNKGSGTVTSVTGTAPVVSSGGATPAISMAAATSSVNGYLTSTDWNTFNNKGNGTVTSVAASVPAFLSIAGSPITTSGTLAISYSGTALPVANGGTATTTAFTTGSVVFAGASGVYSQDNTNFFWDDTNNELGIRTASPLSALHVNADGVGIVGGLSLTNNNGATAGNGAAINFGANSVATAATGQIASVLLVNGGQHGYMTFSTRASNVLAERMRIHFTGGVSIGNTTDPGATNLSVNGVIKIGSNQAVNGPAVSAYKSTNQSITTFTPTKITFDTESFDTNSNFASSTFTPTVAGYYQVSAGFFPSADSTTFSRAFISIYKNGAEWQRLQDVTTIGSFITFLGASGSCLVYCNGSTDYIEAYGFIAGTNPVIGSGSTVTYFDAVMVRGA